MQLGNGLYGISKGPPDRDEIYLYNGNNMGAVATEIARYTKCIQYGFGLTYLDDANLATRVICKRAGLYLISCSGQNGSLAAGVGISINSSVANLSNSIITMDITSGAYGYVSASASNKPACLTRMAFLNVGDVVRPHFDIGIDTGNPLTNYFHVLRVG